MGLWIGAMVITEADESKDYTSYVYNPHFPRAVDKSEEYVINDDGDNQTELATAFSISYGSFHGLKREIADGIDSYALDVGDEFETINNFSDCEGVIGNLACKRLSNFFTPELVKHIVESINQYEKDEFYTNCFLGLIKCINLAASKGGILYYG